MSTNGKPKDSLTAAELLNATTCKHCGQKFPSASVPIIGQPGQAFMEFSQRLIKHLQQRHPEVMAQQFQMSAEFNGLLMFLQFNSKDPEMIENQDRTRHKIFQFCQRAMISDSTIEQKVADLAGIGMPRLIRASDVISLVKEMRDVLTERLLYPPPVISPGPTLPV